MKFTLNTDFTKLPRAATFIRAVDLGADAPLPFDRAVLDHEERHLRRRVLTLTHGDQVLADLAEQVRLENGDVLMLEGGRRVEIIAAEEEVYDVRPRDTAHLAELAWYLGSRHRAAQIEAGRILVLRDPAIRHGLEELGATVAEVSEPFQPAPATCRDNDHDHHHDHDHGHDHHHGGHGHGHHDHDHGHGERDAYGRLPGDPHYGHKHP